MTNDNLLDRILATKQTEIAATRETSVREEWHRLLLDLPPPPDFLAALSDRSRIRVIAEIKKASPSAGVICNDFDPVAIANSYEANGADCISVLTDREYFQGRIEYLRDVSKAVAIPTLRKDFVVDVVQIEEARLSGAAAVLLIAECLDASRLAEFVAYVRELKLTPLVEMHDETNLEAVLASGADLIGINNRDLRTFHTDLNKTIRMLARIPIEKIVVSESAIRTAEDVHAVRAAGARAILVGEAFMRAADPGLKLAELIQCSGG